MTYIHRTDRWCTLVTAHPGGLIRTVCGAELPAREPVLIATEASADYRCATCSPPRKTPWGEGQYDTVQLAPGVLAAVRITRDGQVLMICPGGELTVTDGAVPLSLGLQEASRRAAQIRVRIEDRRRAKLERAQRAVRRRDGGGSTSGAG